MGRKTVYNNITSPEKLQKVNKKFLSGFAIASLIRY